MRKTLWVLLGIIFSAFGFANWVCIVEAVPDGLDCFWEGGVYHCVARYEYRVTCFETGANPDLGGPAGGAPGPGGINQFDVDMDGVIDCWKSTVGAVTYNLTENQKLGSNFGGPNNIRPAHNGIDIPAPIGNAVRSTHSGVVFESDYNSFNGYFVRVDNDDGTQSVYLHLSDQTVEAGDLVGAGAIIGHSGNSGNSSGPHLHLTVYDTPSGAPLNPATELGGEDC